MRSWERLAAIEAKPRCAPFRPMGRRNLFHTIRRMGAFRLRILDASLEELEAPTSVLT
jgi:hypothetical protein